MSKLSDILTIIKKRLFWVPLGEDGEVKYVVINVTKGNIVDMTKKFYEQLHKEGKYGDYITVFTRKEEITMSDLPIFGKEDKYETKWLYRNYEDAVQHDLRERELCLYDRVMRYPGNKELL